MKKNHYLDTIISPSITEKSTSLSDFNKVVFKVSKRANKKAITTVPNIFRFAIYLLKLLKNLT